MLPPDLQPLAQQQMLISTSTAGAFPRSVLRPTHDVRRGVPSVRKVHKPDPCRARAELPLATQHRRSPYNAEWSASGGQSRHARSNRALLQQPPAVKAGTYPHYFGECDSANALWQHKGSAGLPKWAGRFPTWPPPFPANQALALLATAQVAAVETEEIECTKEDFAGREMTGQRPTALQLAEVRSDMVVEHQLLAVDDGLSPRCASASVGSIGSTRHEEQSGEALKIGRARYSRCPRPQWI